MDEKQIKSRETLLAYLGGDEEKLNNYLEKLSCCNKAFDVADRVIKPIYIYEGLSPKTICSRDFYGPIAYLSSTVYGKKIKSDALYYHISSNLLPRWKKEREEIQNRPVEREEDHMDFVLELTPEGRVNVKLSIPVDKLPASFLEMLEPYLAIGYAKLHQKVVKGFDARSGASVYELDCPLLLASDFLMLLKEDGGECMVSYRSASMNRKCISIDEALQMADAEIEESDGE